MYSNPWSSAPISIDPKLDHTNFFLWKLKTRTILESRGLLDITEGTEPLPLTVEDARTWRMRDACARLQIIHNIPDVWLWLVSSAHTAAAAWTSLHAHFQQPSSFRATSALGRFHAARLEEGGDVPAHVQRMGLLWQDVLAAGAGPDAQPDAYFAGQVLASLPPSWDTFVATWRRQAGDRAGVASATVIGRLLDADAWSKGRREDRAGGGVAPAVRGRRPRGGKTVSGDFSRHSMGDAATVRGKVV